MRCWGIVVTAFYAAVVLLLIPGVFLISSDETVGGAISIASEARRVWIVWIWLAILIGGQALLLFLSVDTSRKRLRPRQHIALTAALAGLLAGLLAFAAIWSLLTGILAGRGFALFLWPWGGLDGELAVSLRICAWVLGLWALWGAVFYLHYREASDAVSAAVQWLLRGSVLELLIAVPAHVWLRHRDECSAPIVTGWGIVTGIAVMLLCFGPGILALYAKRAEAYRRKNLGGGGAGPGARP